MSSILKEPTIAGFRTNGIGDVESLLAKIKTIAGNMDFQIFDAEKLAGREHLKVAALHALKAFRQKCNVSKSLGMETAVYASGQRQIVKALKLVGVKPETRKVAVIVFGGEAESFLKSLEEKLAWIRDDSVLEEWDLNNLQKLYGIGEEELKAAEEALGLESREAFQRLLWEKMSLLAAQV
ncbi:hypothetical protein DRO53_02060 [Candidatus Bathyarchaeota archaeon]|nr:MAG: hypothetical protein DRO53_02060 [Candidatus Bathyarchaeota archaeon]